MATILYLHGFASAGAGPKMDALRETFPDHAVLAPDIPTDPVQAQALLDGVVRKITSYPVIAVGTSLGGFWANYLAQVYDMPAILVNPSTEPAVTMASRVGKVIKNYRTGADITVTSADVAKFDELTKIMFENYNGTLIDVLVTKDDDVIDFQRSLDNLRFWRSCAVLDTGGHQFLSNWGRVIDLVRQRLGDAKSEAPR